MLTSLFYGLTSCIGVVSSTLGIGGGCLLISLFTSYSNHFDWMQTRYIAPLVTTTVLSNNLVRSLYYTRKKNDIHENFPLIDYSVMTLMAPFDTIGSYIGIKVNEYVGYTNIKYITLALFLSICVKLVLRLLKNSRTSKIYSIPLIYDKKLNFIPQISVYSLTLSMGILGYYYLSIISCLLLGLYSGVYNLKMQSSPNIIWNKNNVVVISIGSLFIGFLSTLVGIGGSMISTPMLLSLDFKPNIIISTNSLSGLFSTISSTMQYYSKDRILFDESLKLFVINFISCILGTFLSLKLQKGNEKVYTSFLLVLVIFCSYLYILRI